MGLAPPQETAECKSLCSSRSRKAPIFLFPPPPLCSIFLSSGQHCIFFLDGVEREERTGPFPNPGEGRNRVAEIAFFSPPPPLLAFLLPLLYLGFFFANDLFGLAAQRIPRHLRLLARSPFVRKERFSPGPEIEKGRRLNPRAIKDRRDAPKAQIEISKLCTLICIPKLLSSISPPSPPFSPSPPAIADTLQAQEGVRLSGLSERKEGGPFLPLPPPPFTLDSKNNPNLMDTHTHTHPRSRSTLSPLSLLFSFYPPPLPFPSL